MLKLSFVGAFQEQRDAVVNALNNEYKEMRVAGASQVDAFISLASKFPYRLLSQKKKVRIINLS